MAKPRITYERWLAPGMWWTTRFCGWVYHHRTLPGAYGQALYALKMFGDQ